MSRTSLVLALALTLSPIAALRAQESPADQAYQRVTQKIVEAEQAPSTEKGKVYAELFRECGTFLDQHLRGASPDQLAKAGGLWLLLAERLGAPERAVRDRITALRSLPSLPSQLTRLVEKAEAKLALTPGGTAPAWKAKDIKKEGAEVTSESLGGKLVLLAFWAAERESCRDFMQHVVLLQRRYAEDARLAMVWVGVPWMSESEETERRVTGELGYEGKAVFDTDESVVNAFKVKGVPHLVLIDEQGAIVSAGTDLDAIDRFLTERLGPGKAPPSPPAQEPDGQ